MAELAGRPEGPRSAPPVDGLSAQPPDRVSRRGAEPCHPIGPNERLGIVLAALNGWAVFAPLGLRYAALLALTAWCVARWISRRSQPYPRTGPEPWPRAALLAWWLLTGWMALSAAWSPAPPMDRVGAVWHVALLLAAPLWACALTPAAAQAGLRHWVWAAGAMGALLVMGELLRPAMPTGTAPQPGGWPERLLQALVEPEGNQRVGLSMWLAIGASLAVLKAVQLMTIRTGPTAPASTVPPSLWPAVVAGAFALAGLLLQDRRSGWLLLPLLLALVAWHVPTRPAARVAAVLGALALSAGLVMGSGEARARLAEGWQQVDEALRWVQHGPAGATSSTAATASSPANPGPSAGDPDGPAWASSSWGARVLMQRLSLAWVAEAPLLGHGAGSWQTLWREAMAHGGAQATTGRGMNASVAAIPPDQRVALQVHSTPHQDALTLAVQAGWPAALLYGAGLAIAFGAAWRRGAVALPWLMGLSALAAAGLFNAALRDAKLALPLLVLMGLGAAAAQCTEPAVTTRGNPGNTS